MKKYIKPTSPKQAGINQPSKDSKTKKKQKQTINKNNEYKKKKVYKSQKIAPTKDSNIKELYIRKNDTPKEKKHPEFGTSNLEKKFAKEFLEKLNVDYQWQFKAESIGRYFDYYIPSANLLIELDGDFYHGYNILYENMSPMQKKNNRVDRDKDKWAKEHKIPLIRIWEHEINKEPSKVMNMLKTEIKIYTEKYNKILEKKNKPINKK